MLRYQLTLAIVALAIPASTQAAKYKLDLEAQANQQSRMENGVEAVNSDQSSTSVRIFEVEEPLKKRGSLLLYALNAGDAPLNLGAENVRMEAEDGTPIQIITYDQQVKEEKRRQTWRAIAAGLAAAGNNMSAANAGYSHGTVSAYGSGGWAQGTFSTYNSGQAYAASALAERQNQAMFNRLGATSAAAMEALRVNLRTTTLDPGDSFGGQIVYELPKSLRNPKEPLPVLIHVSLGEETHTFRAFITRQ